MSQFLRPSSDISTGAWTTTPLFSKVNETSSNDSPFITSPNNSNTTCDLGLSTGDTPDSGTRTLRIRARKGTQSNNRGLNYNVKQGGTSVESGTVEASLTSTFTTYTISIAGTITDYSNLSIELSSTGTTGGAPGNRAVVDVSWVELEIPDPPASQTYNESVTLDSVHNLSTVGALGPRTYSRDIMFSMRTFLENESELIPVSNVYEESTILSSINLLTTTEELLANGIITLTSNNTIDVANDATVNNSVSIISNNDLSVQSNLDINGNTQLASDSTIDVTGGLDVNDSTSITADTEVNVNNDLTINQNISLIIDNNVNVQSNIEASGIISLTGDGQVGINGNIDVNNSVSLESDLDIVSQNNIIADSSVSLESDGGFNEQSLADYLNSSILLSDSNIELTTEQIAELTISLLAASQLDVSIDDGEYFKLVSLQMNNQVLFDLFTEAYNSLSLLSETITTFDVVLAVSNLLELNINTDVIVEISNILDSAVSLSTVNTIQTEGEVETSGTTYNESTVLTINIDLFFVDSVGKFMKMIGALFIKNINKIIG